MSRKTLLHQKQLKASSFSPVIIQATMRPCFVEENCLFHDQHTSIQDSNSAYFQNSPLLWTAHLLVLVHWCPENLLFFLLNFHILSNESSIPADLEIISLLAQNQFALHLKKRGGVLFSIAHITNSSITV